MAYQEASWFEMKKKMKMVDSIDHATRQYKHEAKAVRVEWSIT